MQMQREGREWVSWDLAEPPAGPLEVSFDGGEQWHDMERDGDTVRVLIAGPEAGTNPAGTVPLPLGRSVATIRMVDDPEILVRRAGPIDIT